MTGFTEGSNWALNRPPVSAYYRLRTFVRLVFPINGEWVRIQAGWRAMEEDGCEW